MKKKPKFKAGDKVVIVKKGHGNNEWRNEELPDGGVAMIKNEDGERDGQFVYSVNGSRYILYEDEIDLASRVISVRVPMDNKKTAHKLAHEAVEQAFKEWEGTKTPEPKSEDWTEEEIRTAQKACADLVHYVVMNDGDVSWSIDEGGVIRCVRYRGFKAEDATFGEAVPMKDDVFNVWIGKCVSLYHALGFELPEFIKLKNVKR